MSALMERVSLGKSLVAFEIDVLVVIAKLGAEIVLEGQGKRPETLTMCVYLSYINYPYSYIKSALFVSMVDIRTS